MTIPELGTIKAEEPPIVIITSNRTREVHDALKRRCLYHWVGYPDAKRELAIVQARRPNASKALAQEVVLFVQALRGVDLYKSPGVAETLDWVSALHELDSVTLDPQTVNDTLGVLLKYQDDIVSMEGSEAKRILDQIKDEIRTMSSVKSSLMSRPRPTSQHPSPVPSGKLAHNIMHFARVLRQAGLPVGPGAVIDALDAALTGSIRTRDDFYWTLHAIFIKRRDHKEVFDQAFHVFWKKPKMLEQLMQLMFHQISRDLGEKAKQAGFRRLAEAMFDKNDAPSSQRQKKEELEVDASFTASADEMLRAKDFEQMTVAEQAHAKQAIARLRMHRTEVMTRRYQRADERPGHRHAPEPEGLAPGRWAFHRSRTPRTAMARAAARRALRYFRLVLQLQPHVPAFPARACRMTASG